MSRDRIRLLALVALLPSTAAAQVWGPATLEALAPAAEQGQLEPQARDALRAFPDDSALSPAAWALVLADAEARGDTLLHCEAAERLVELAPERWADEASLELGRCLARQGSYLQAARAVKLDPAAGSGGWLPDGALLAADLRARWFSTDLIDPGQRDDQIIAEGLAAWEQFTALAKMGGDIVEVNRGKRLQKDLKALQRKPTGTYRYPAERALDFEPQPGAMLKLVAEVAATQAPPVILGAPAESPAEPAAEPEGVASEPGEGAQESVAEEATAEVVEEPAEEPAPEVAVEEPAPEGRTTAEPAAEVVVEEPAPEPEAVEEPLAGAQEPAPDAVGAGEAEDSGAVSVDEAPGDEPAVEEAASAEAAPQQAPAGPGGFRDAGWAMSQREVADLEDRTPRDHDRDKLVYNDKLDGMHCVVVYTFEGGALAKGAYAVTDRYREPEQAYAAWQHLLELLQTKYGAAAPGEHLRWLGPPKEGKELAALAVGKSEYEARWEFADTTIELKLSHPRERYKLRVIYRAGGASEAQRPGAGALDKL